MRAPLVLISLRVKFSNNTLSPETLRIGEHNKFRRVARAFARQQKKKTPTSLCEAGAISRS
jgi:hypothetical protein